MTQIRKVIVTFLALLGVCFPFILSVIFLDPIPDNFNLPLTAQVFSAIGVFTLLFFTYWVSRFVVLELWEDKK